MKLTQTDILNLMRDKAYRPLLLKEMIEVFVVPRKERQAFRNTIVKMQEEGLIVKIRGDRYGLPEKMNLITGVLQGHPDGYGFVISDAEGEPDVYIPRRYMMGAMHNDRVVARIEAYKKDERLEGRIIRILERFHKKIVGRFERGKDFGFVIPSDRKIFQDIYVAPQHFYKVKDGDIVVARIMSYPQRARNPEGEIIKILGRPTTAGIDTDMIIEEYELPYEFPVAVLAQAETIPADVTVAMIKGRVDLRGLKTVTIDGERAKDFDDAVSIERVSDRRVRLWVHIADVSYYVPWDSALDKEANSRGTSVYLPDRVIPMFPEKLSNQICSLNPKEDRLTLTIEMLFDGNGNRQSYKIYESIINSNERMTYTSVKRILEEPKKEPKKEIDKEQIERYNYLVEDFLLMKELCLKLRSKRMKRGSIEFDLPEPEIILDLQSKTINIVKAGRNIAHQIIEEFMLVANETVAQHMGSKEIPFIYRIHEPPDEDRIHEFNKFINSLGYMYRLNHRHPRTFQGLLKKIEGKPEETLINQLMLRSMKQARYSTENLCHFGLSSQHYTHFTSPIRRYPDLIVHRLIKEVSKRLRLKEERRSKLDNILKDIAKHSSERERVAMEAEREVIELKKLEFMQDKIGVEYKGVISGVIAFGFFVELEDILVEGLVRVTSIYDDFYRYEERQHRLVGDRSGKVFRLGDEVTVRVDRVDMERRKIDFILA